MKKGPRVSFIIPTRNEADYIKECLLSIKNQKRKDFEIIVVDSSDDETPRIARMYADKVLKEKKKGPGAARNKGATYAKGKILVFADADVRFEPDFLNRLIEFEQPGNPGNHIAGVCNLKFFDGDAKTNIFFMIWNWIVKILSKMGIATTNGSCFVYDKEVFEMVNGFSPSLLTNEDNDLARRVRKHRRFQLFDIPVYTSMRRVKQMGLSSFLKQQMKSTFLYVLNKKSLKDYWD